jgi:hypothetical protein
MPDPDIGSDDIFNIDTMDVGDTPAPKSKGQQPLFQVFKQSRIAVSSSVGKMWERKVKAAIKAHELTLRSWDEVLKYYNNRQDKAIDTTRGIFKRGDGTENVIFSNLNIMLPAVYSKDPDITCSTIDDSEAPFCKALEKLLNTLIRGKQALNAKPKVKKAAGMGLLTNFGVLKIDYTKKDDSRELAVNEMVKITQALAKAKNIEHVERLYGELEALERQMEVLKPSGPSLGNVLSHNLIVDPYAEQQDGLDSNWMCERVWFPTNMLTARFTEPDPDSGDQDVDGTGAGSRVLIYKPTHKAMFDTADGRRDDGLGFVQQAFESGNENSKHTDDERTAYLNMYSTECYLLWDKATKRVMLFHRDDWTWPLWVWDDPLNISRFFPYYIVGYTFSTGGTVTVGETSYYLDQQDQINDINRKLKTMRTSVFDYFLYNSDKADSDQIEKLINAMRGENTGGNTKHVLGIKAGEGKISDILESIYPNMEKFKELFDKQGLLDAINRITNTSDALRGVQFKTNTNEDAVNTYQESMKLSVGAKVDVLEDVVADIAISLAELCIQNLTQNDVIALIGQTLGQNYKQMSVPEFTGNYNLEIVAGSMEKPNSVFKKREAVQIAQAVGQFAQAAPGATLQIMLRVLEQAFTEVVIKPEDWQAINTEIQAKAGQGVGAPTGTAAGAQPSPTPGATQGAEAQQGPVTPTQASGPGQPPGQNISQLLASIPPDIKSHVVQMKQSGADPHAIMSYLLQHVASLHAGGQGAPPAGNGQQAPQAQGTVQ